jgi:multidrug efflux pump subunit AcrA (membrane-fusion protein)
MDDSLAEVSEEMRLYIPRQLILQSESGPYVWLADQSAGVARQTPVTLGRTVAGNLVEVTGGLTVTSRVIASGYESLSDGDRIRVVDGDAHIASSGALPAGEQHTMKRLHNEGE